MTASAPRSVLLAGGGTAGHVSPLLALADCLRRRDPDVRVTALGTAAGLEARLVPERGYRPPRGAQGAVPRRPSGDLLRLPGNLRRAVRAAEEAIDDTGAEVVVGFGGYVSTPAYLAARRRHVPVVVHEQNARPGLANRLGARLAAAVAVTFRARPCPTPPSRGCRCAARSRRSTERPCAPRRASGSAWWSTAHRPRHGRFARRAAAQRRLRRRGRRPVPRRRPGPAHHRGRQGLHPVGASGAPYVVVPYCDRMDLAYAAADLVVARSGANTVCELTAVGLPAVYVPLPDRQRGAAAQRRGGRRRGWRRPRRRRRRERALGGRRRGPLATDAGSARDDGHGIRVGGGAGRRRAARRPRPPGRGVGAR